MKYLMIVFCFLMTSFNSTLAQTNQTPLPQPSRSGRQNSGTATTDVNGGFDALHSLEIPQTSQKSLGNMRSEEIQSLYRKPSKKDLENLMPSQILITQYENFLKQPNTGIFKLSGDSNCAINTNVIVATENCLSNSIPGAGTAFSFRVNSHRMLHLADLILEKEVIKTDGILQQGLMVSLGNIELEGVSAQTPGVKFLFDFRPANNLEEFQKIDQELSNGITADGLIYRLGFYAGDKTTFALRSIAYRGKVARSVSGISYNELDFDKRKDVVIIFRIIEKGSNGDITILWKELSRVDSPVLKIIQKDK